MSGSPRGDLAAPFVLRQPFHRPSGQESGLLDRNLLATSPRRSVANAMSPAQPSDHGGKKLVLGRMNLGRQGFQGVRGLDAHHGLVEDRATVDLRSDKMDGAARHLDAPAERLTDSIQTGKAREQARVEVDNAAGEGLQEAGFKDPHEAGEDDQVRLGRLDGGDETRLTLALELGLERGGIDELGPDAEAWPEGKDAGIGAVRKNGHDLGATEVAGVLGLEDGFGVGAAAGTKNDDPHGFKSLPPPGSGRSGRWC